MNECTNVLAYRYKPRRITIEKQYEENIPKIFADAKQLEQVFINLLNNAIDAITSKGSITVGIRKSTEEREEKIEIQVEDSGTGIRPEILDKVFTPFFSTKSNQGTGLGLSIVKAIVARHGGVVRINSVPDKGTTVRIILPIFRNER
jgi:two-component system sensor histidine kinase AtoS